MDLTKINEEVIPVTDLTIPTLSNRRYLLGLCSPHKLKLLLQSQDSIHNVELTVRLGKIFQRKKMVEISLD